MIPQKHISVPQISFLQISEDSCKQASSSKEAGIQFKDVLNTVAERGVKTDKYRIAAGKDTGQRTGQEVVNKDKGEYNSYHNIKADKKFLVNSGNMANDKKAIKQYRNIMERTADEKESIKDYDIVLAALAQLFEVEAQDLHELFDRADIKLETLADASKSGEIYRKLTVYLELDDEQNSLMKNIINSISMFLRENSGKSDNGYSKATRDYNRIIEKNLFDETENPENSEILPAVSTRPKNHWNFNEILSKVKLKLNELLKKSDADPQKFIDGIFQKMEFLFCRDEAEEGIVYGIKTTEVIEKPNTAENEIKPKFIKLEKDDESKKLKNQGDDWESADVRDIEDSKSKSQLEDDGDGVFFNNHAVFKIPNEYEAQKVAGAAKELQIFNKEIINQVLDKAKVITNGEKTEAVIQLKPESLGKLSLKIVTENGIVAAKFMAESRQVKQVLEINMHILKDSLEKQGLQVQGLSVSVEQNSADRFKREKHFADGRTKSPSSNANLEIGMARTADFSVIQQRIDLYYWKDSKINLTA